MRAIALAILAAGFLTITAEHDRVGVIVGRWIGLIFALACVACLIAGI